MITLSPLRMDFPSNSMSDSAVRRMWASGVCQRMISGTMFGIKDRSAFSLAYCAGYWLSASTPPEIELRVVSLPPTISSIRLPKSSIGSLIMSRVSGSWASNEMKSNLGGAAARSRHRSEK